MTVGTSGARRGRRHGRRSPGSGRRQEGQALDHHRVAPRQFVQLVIPAVAPVAVELQEVLVGAAIAPRGRCGVDVDGLLLGLGGAAPASALTLPPSSSQRPASNRAWLACRSSSRQRDQPSAGGRSSLPSFRSARSSRSLRSLKARRPAPADPHTAGTELADRIGPAAGVIQARLAGHAFRMGITGLRRATGRPASSSGSTRSAPCLRPERTAAFRRGVRCLQHENDQNHDHRDDERGDCDGAGVHDEQPTPHRAGASTRALAHWRPRDEGPGHLHEYERSDPLDLRRDAADHGAHRCR
jgi:hypothetical protein